MNTSMKHIVLCLSLLIFALAIFAQSTTLEAVSEWMANDNRVLAVGTTYPSFSKGIVGDPLGKSNPNEVPFTELASS